jgi:SAM-dependent methyltransferase
MPAALAVWLRRCPGCGLWASELGREGDRLRARTGADEERRGAFEPLRLHNFALVLDALSRFLALPGARVLDVGCGYGWFLEAARGRGALGLGLEPDAPVAARVRERGLDVRTGYFPDALDPGERFDAIVFNDVFEHLADPARVLEACHRALRPDGKLVLNLPSSDGAFFRVACALARCGAPGALRRLWRADYRSPHLFYWSARNLERLAGAHGFRRVHGASLPSVRVRGLWSRLRMDRSRGALAAALVWTALVPVVPVLTVLAPPDILVQIYERQETV